LIFIHHAVLLKTFLQLPTINRFFSPPYNKNHPITPLQYFNKKTGKGRPVFKYY